MTSISAPTCAANPVAAAEPSARLRQGPKALQRSEDRHIHRDQPQGAESSHASCSDRPRCQGWRLLRSRAQPAAAATRSLLRPTNPAIPANPVAAAEPSARLRQGPQALQRSEDRRIHCDQPQDAESNYASCSDRPRCQDWRLLRSRAQPAAAATRSLLRPPCKSCNSCNSCKPCSRCRAFGEAATRAKGPSSDLKTGALIATNPRALNRATRVVLVDRAGRIGVSCGAGRSLRQRLHEAFCARPANPAIPVAAAEPLARLRQGPKALQRSEDRHIHRDQPQGAESSHASCSDRPRWQGWRLLRSRAQPAAAATRGASASG